MAKTTAAQMLVNVAADLKAELRRLVRVITATDDADVPAQTFRDAELVLSQLQRLHSLRRSPAAASSDPQPKVFRSSGPRSPPPPPDHFVCLISGELMKDPVVLASGETFDRPFIQRRLDSGDRTCPRTQEVLSDATLIPNNHLRRMISNWCSEHGVSFKCPGDGELVVTRADREKLDELLDTISTSTLRADRKAAFREIRQLTRSDRSLRELFGINPDAVLKLVSAPTDDDPESQEDKVTAVFNLTLQDCNRKAIGVIPCAIAFLISSLGSGTMQSRGNAAATLFNLAILNANKAVIGEMGAMGPLVVLLRQGSPAAKLDTVRALFDLCMCQENKSRAVDAGAVKALLRCIADGSQVDGSLAVLAVLSGSSQQVRDDIGGSGGMEILLRVMRESASEKNKENAVALVHAGCMSDRLRLQEVREEEEVHGTVTQVKEKGTERARRKAGQILDRLRRMALGTYNSC